MLICGNCGIEMMPKKYVVRKYCSRRCSNIQNNILHPKRKKQRLCPDCFVPIKAYLVRCPDCKVKASLIRKEKYRERKAKRNSRKVIEWRRNLKIKAVEYKGGKCVRCGYCKSLRALQFHHRDPEQKDFAISRPNPRSWEKVKVELDKCDLLCANCHSELHDELYAAGM